MAMQLDKLVHGLSCYAVTTVAFFVLLLFARPWVAFGVSLALGVSVGAGKELYDKAVPGHVASAKDLLADGLGLLVALALELAVVLNLAA